MSDPVVPSPAAPLSAAPTRRRADPLLLSWVASLLLLAALLLGNAALARTSARVDLTQDRLYTLSDSTKAVLGRLTDPVRVRVYWDEKIPTDAKPVKQRLEGLLDEYAAASKGLLDVTWVRMDEAGLKEAADRSIPQTEHANYSTTSVSKVVAYEGISLSYESKVEQFGPLGQLSDDRRSYELNSSLEYNLTAALQKLVRSKQATVGVVREAPPQFMQMQGRPDRFTVLPARLTQIYGDGLRDKLSLDDPVPGDVDVLVVLGPREWTDKRVFHLEQYLLRGGKVLLLLDPVDAATAFGGQPAAKSGLEAWLAGSGISLAEGCLAEYDPDHQGFAPTGSGEYIGFAPWVLVRGDGLDRTVGALRGFDAALFYFPAEIVADAKQQEKDGRQLRVLARTTAFSARVPDVSGVQAAAQNRPPMKDLDTRAVGISLEGTFQSFWKGKPSPVDPPPPPPSAPVDPGMAEGPAMEGSEPGMDAPPAPAPAEPAAPAPSAPKDPPPPPTPPTPPQPTGPKGPEGEEGAPGPAMGDPAGAGAAAGPKRLDEGKGTLYVLSDAELVSDQFSRVPGKDRSAGTTSINGNAGFVMVTNLIGMLSGGDDLMALRSRGTATRKFTELSEATGSRIRLFNFVGAPVLILIAGLLVYFVRKHRS